MFWFMTCFNLVAQVFVVQGNMIIVKQCMNAEKFPFALKNIAQSYNQTCITYY